MKGIVRDGGAALVVLGLALGMGALTRVPYEAPHAHDAVVRLSWRTRGEEVRECRTLSAEEQAGLPVHMRRSEVCEGRVLPRHLQVELDGRIVLDDTLHASGARGDRPLYVYQEIPVAAGAHHLQVSFVREDAAATATDGRTATMVPPTLTLDTRLALSPGEVALVTYDPGLRALVVRAPEGSGGR